jgi:uncharacterized RDD family membrane protein YckC
VVPASQGKRFAHLIIDQIVVTLLVNCAGFVLGFAYALSRANVGSPLTPQEETMLNGWGWGVTLLVSVAYFVICEGLFSRTLGKFITGTKVVTADGGPPSLGQVLGRTFARFIPFEHFSFLGTPAVGWHDSLSGTRVVDANQGASA